MIGCTLVFDIGPFSAEDDWMPVQLGVPPRSVLRHLRMFGCKNGPSFELFEYDTAAANATPPPNSDAGATHLGFCFADVAAAVAYLQSHGIRIQGAPVTMDSGPAQGLTSVYFLSPWRMQLELVSYPDGLAVKKAAHGLLWSPKAG